MIDDCDVGKAVDVDKEDMCTLIVVVVVVTHKQEVVPMYNFYEEEGIVVACLSDDHRILFLFCDQAVAGYGSMNAEEMIDTLLVTFRLENDRIHTMGAY